ncbi:MAG: caspase family protein [Leptolyngbyaceae bacterium]|nr:caspase family protein [Leptolyngbyaceae bacterium]
MTKIALLIGINHYGDGLPALTKPHHDVEAIARVLSHPKMGAFTDVKKLLDPTPQVMSEAIERVFSHRKRDDLVLLFFSGHGIKDESGRLYLGTTITRKDDRGTLVRSSAIPASFVQDIMSNSRSRHQVVVLDCCYSGAFAEGMRAKDDGAVGIQTQLSGEGRVVLTSSSSTQYSFEQDSGDCSIYTRYLLEGIETGAADLDNDGVVAVDELHEYARRKVREISPAMKPEIYAVKEGFKILLTQVPMDAPELKALRYRKEVERFARRGTISEIGKSALAELQKQLELPGETAETIISQVLKPHQQYQEKLHRYEQAFSGALQREEVISDATREDLTQFHNVLGLRREDVELIEAEALSRRRAAVTEGQQRQLAELYAQALNDIRNEEWSEAIARLQRILDQAPTYEDAIAQRQVAQRQQELADLYAAAMRAYDCQAWAEAVKRLKMVAVKDAGYRDVQAKLAIARRERDTQQWQRMVEPVAQISLDIAGEQHSHPPKKPQTGVSPYASSRPLSNSRQDLLLFTALMIAAWAILGLLGWIFSQSMQEMPSFVIPLALIGLFGGMINGGVIWLSLQRPGQSLQIAQAGLFLGAGGVLGAIVWAMSEYLIVDQQLNEMRVGAGAIVGATIAAVLGTGILWWLSLRNQKSST